MWFTSNHIKPTAQPSGSLDFTLAFINYVVWLVSFQEIYVHILDMTETKKVWEFAESFKRKYKTLNVLVGNMNFPNFMALWWNLLIQCKYIFMYVIQQATTTLQCHHNMNAANDHLYIFNYTDQQCRLHHESEGCERWRSREELRHQRPRWVKNQSVQN